MVIQVGPRAGEGSPRLINADYGNRQMAAPTGLTRATRQAGRPISTLLLPSIRPTQIRSITEPKLVVPAARSLEARMAGRRTPILAWGTVPAVCIPTPTFW